jgi:hypothetical protein
MLASLLIEFTAMLSSLEDSRPLELESFTQRIFIILNINYFLANNF